MSKVSIKFKHLIDTDAYTFARMLLVAQGLAAFCAWATGRPAGRLQIVTDNPPGWNGAWWVSWIPEGAYQIYDDEPARQAATR